MRLYMIFKNWRWRWQAVKVIRVNRVWDQQKWTIQAQKTWCVCVCVSLPHFFLPQLRWNINEEDDTLTHILYPPLAGNTHIHTHTPLRSDGWCHTDISVGAQREGLCRRFRPVRWRAALCWIDGVQSEVFPSRSSENPTRSECLPFDNQFTCCLKVWAAPEFVPSSCCSPFTSLWHVCRRRPSPRPRRAAGN